MTVSLTPYRYVLIPGRHHVLTQFQARYLADLLRGRLKDSRRWHLTFAADAEVVWAVTSANHANTRRNPIPANRREVAIELFSLREGLRSLVVSVLDVARRGPNGSPGGCHLESLVLCRRSRLEGDGPTDVGSEVSSRWR